MPQRTPAPKPGRPRDPDAPPKPEDSKGLKGRAIYDLAQERGQDTFDTLIDIVGELLG